MGTVYPTDVFVAFLIMNVESLLFPQRSPEVLKLCHGLRVPQQRGQSLNVGTTGAICLHELCKKSRPGAGLRKNKKMKILVGESLREG